MTVRRLLFAASGVAALACSAGLVLAMRDAGFFAVIAGFMATLLVGLPAAGLGLIGHLMWKRTGWRALHWATTGLVCVAILAGPQAVTTLPALALSHYDEVKAKRFCEDLIPALEAHRRAKGRYPRSIDEVLHKGESLPYRLRSGDFYSYYGESYCFSFAGSGPLGMWIYSSETGQWVED